MIPDLTDKTWAVFGLKGTGKSVLVHYICSRERAHFVFDPLGEHEGLNRYTPRHRDEQGIPELEAVISRVVLGSGKVRLFAIDEANRYCRPRRPLPGAVLQLNDFSRHYQVSFGLVARRPVQLHADLVELAAYLFVFNLKGVNDSRYLDYLCPGLGDAVATLPPYHFVVVAPDRSYAVHPPLPL